MPTAYARAVTLAAMLQPLEVLVDTNYRKMLGEIIELISTEFDAAVTGQDGYTVTTGLLASMMVKLRNIPNLTQRRILRDLLTLVVAEFALAGDGTLLNYTVSTFTTPTVTFTSVLQRTVHNQPNVLNKHMLFGLIDQLILEFETMEAATA